MPTGEETGRKVQRILAGEFSNVRLTKDGGFAIDQGSSVVFIEPKDWTPAQDGTPRSLVRIWAPLGRKVKSTPEMYRWAAVEGSSKYFGSVTVLENEDASECFLMFDHTLLGDFVDPDELITSVYAVMFTGDEFDDIVHDRFGGKRYTDPD